MVKLLISLFLGILLHKALYEIHDYSWWKHSKLCYKSVSHIEPHEKAILARDACFMEQMGPIWYLRYVLVRPQIGKNKFFTESGWGF